MEKPIIRIAAKFQYKIPSLRTLASMDTISWSRRRPHRKTCTFLQRSWIRKAAVDVTLSSARNWEIGAENRSVEHYYYYYYYFYYYYYYCCCCFCRWWYLLLGLLVLWPSISSLLQSATSVITKCARYYKVRQFYYKVRQNIPYAVCLNRASSLEPRSFVLSWWIQLSFYKGNLQV